MSQALDELRTLLVAHFRGDPDGQVSAAALAKAARKAAKTLAAEEAEKFRAWQQAIAHFAQLEEDAQAIEVARGLRLCRLLAGAPKPRREQPRALGPLSMATDTLPGIGPKAAAVLSERGIDCVGDLVSFVPRRYDDARAAVALADITDEGIDERVTISAEVESRALVRRGKRRWLDVRFVEGDSKLIVRFFGAFPSALDRYAVGTPVTMAGALSKRGNFYEMSNPDVLAIGSQQASGPQILPRYSAVPGVAGKRLASATQVAVDRAAASLVSAVPSWVESELELPALEESFRSLHAPPDDGGRELAEMLNERTSPWQRRLAFEEMFVLAAEISRRRAERRAGQAIACDDEVGLTARAETALPFELTDAQSRVTAEIASDVAKATPMNRLLQGDVGCGKTAVAFLAAAAAIGSGCQVALMAPTEILAEQHAASLKALADKVGVRVALLTGSLRAGQKRSLLALLAAHKIDLVVGTHALIAESVAFAKLGLVIVDEQHRFGVAQRVRLRRKGLSPHMLVMTATPIPRSLALSVYGDLDVSVIDELPPGRSPTETHVMKGDSGRAATYAALIRRIERGERAFVVCPLVEPSNAEVSQPWRSAIEVHRELALALPGASVGLVHGRLAHDERTLAMERFRRGDDQVLACTTVIEVGVDVPEATVIIIEDADHFGLAQLHQLRGRVGRGELAGHCALLCQGRLTADAGRRLEVMARTCDGFEIAERDLEIRGPGELLGSQQAGLPPMRFGDLRAHLDLLTTARRYAAQVIESDPGLEREEHAGLRAALEAADARRGEREEAFDAESG